MTMVGASPGRPSRAGTGVPPTAPSIRRPPTITVPSFTGTALVPSSRARRASSARGPRQARRGVRRTAATTRSFWKNTTSSLPQRLGQPLL